MQVFVKLRTTAHIIITTNLSSKIFKLCTFWLEEFSGLRRLNYGERKLVFLKIYFIVTLKKQVLTQAYY